MKRTFLRSGRKGWGFVIPAFVALFLLSGCALSRMIRLSADQKITVKPNPLELHGNELAYEVVADLPPKILPKGKVYTLKLAYVTDNERIDIGAMVLETVRRNRLSRKEQPTNEAESLVVDGESTRLSQPNDNNPYLRAAKRFTLDYTPDFSRGVIEVQSVASNPINQASKSSDWVVWGKGALLSSELIQPVIGLSYAAHGYIEGEELLPHDIDFFFEQSSARLRRSETQSERAALFTAFLSEQNVVRKVSIVGSHSPEGTERINTSLAAERAQAIADWYKTQMERYDYQNVSDSVIFESQEQVLNWTPLREKVRVHEALSEEEKASWLAVINGRGEFEDKEKRLQELPTYRRVFDEVYPQLRTAKTHLLVVKKKRTKEEIAALSRQLGVQARALQTESASSNESSDSQQTAANDAPDAQVADAQADTEEPNAPDDSATAGEGEEEEPPLSNEELLYGATLTPVLDEKESIYEAAIQQQDTWISHNNLGCVYLEQAQVASGVERQALIDRAVVQFELAANLQQEPIAEVTTNLSIAYLLQGSNAQAYDQLVLALTQNPNEELTRRIHSAKGTLEAQKGAYQEAVTSLSAAEDKVVVLLNLGIVHLLRKEYTQAQNVLNSALSKGENHAYVHYALAVLGARTNKRNTVQTHLTAAVAALPSLKERAVLDLEFENYADVVRTL